MKRRLLLLSVLLVSGKMLNAQTLNTVSGLRLYEHHSPTISGSQSADGSQSGYDFVMRRYFHSYNAANFGAYMNGEEANIDLVEHNGPYGNGQNGSKFGFTSGTSTIWVNEIKGNGTTRWMKAPAGFNYATITSANQIASAYSGTTAVQSIPTVEENTVYLGRIRNSSLYVAIKTSAVKNKTTSDLDVYFDFEYKYGMATTTGIGKVEQSNRLVISPNPANQRITLENTSSQVLMAKIIAPNGQQVQTFSIDGNGKVNVAIEGLASGLYFIVCRSADGMLSTQKLIKNQ